MQYWQRTNQLNIIFNEKQRPFIWGLSFWILFLHRNVDIFRILDHCLKLSNYRICPCEILTWTQTVRRPRSRLTNWRPMNRRLTVPIYDLPFIVLVSSMISTSLRLSSILFFGCTSGWRWEGCWEYDGVCGLCPLRLCVWS